MAMKLQEMNNNKKLKSHKEKMHMIMKVESPTSSNINLTNTAANNTNQEEGETSEINSIEGRKSNVDVNNNNGIVNGTELHHEWNSEELYIPQNADSKNDSDENVTDHAQLGHKQGESVDTMEIKK